MTKKKQAEEQPVVVVKDAAFAPPEEVAKRLVVLTLGFSQFGVRRKLDSKKVVAAPKEEALMGDAREAVHVGKDILKSEALDELRKYASDVRNFAIAQAVPARFLKGGMHLEPALLLERIDERLRDHAEKWATLVDSFVEDYEEQVPDPEAEGKTIGRLQLAARTKLRSLGEGFYDPKDYPSSAAVRACFRMTWRWLEFSVPEKLRETNPALWQAEMEKAREMWAEAAAEITAGMREGVAAVVAKLAARLEPGEDGKKKALRQDSFAALDEALESFPFKNVTGDEALRVEVEKLKALRRGVDVDDLKKYGGLRDKLRKDLVAVGARLEKLVEEAPERRISFDDDEAA